MIDAYIRKEVVYALVSKVSIFSHDVKVNVFRFTTAVLTIRQKIVYKLKTKVKLIGELLNWGILKRGYNNKLGYFQKEMKSFPKTNKTIFKNK